MEMKMQIFNLIVSLFKILRKWRNALESKRVRTEERIQTKKSLLPQKEVTESN